MQFAYDFFKSDQDLNMGFEDRLCFIFDNYDDIMTLYRVIEIQIEKNTEAKLQAHQDLNAERARIDQLRRQNHQFTPAEKKANKERLNYLKNLRDEDRPIYFQKEVIGKNEATMIIKKMSYFIRLIDIIEQKGRPWVSKIYETSSKVLLWPFNKSIEYFILNCHKRFLPAAEYFQESLKAVPDVMKKRFEINIDLSEHIPNDV
jgi:hypothetical protein